MQEQTRQSLQNVKTILEAAGSSLDSVVKITVLLARPDQYKEMNKAYMQFFPGPKPARAMARFGADIPGVLVAIEAIEAIATIETTGRLSTQLRRAPGGWKASAYRKSKPQFSPCATGFVLTT